MSLNRPIIIIGKVQSRNSSDVQLKIEKTLIKINIEKIKNKLDIKLNNCIEVKGEIIGENYIIMDSFKDFGDKFKLETYYKSL